MEVVQKLEQPFFKHRKGLWLAEVINQNAGSTPFVVKSIDASICLLANRVPDLQSDLIRWIALVLRIAIYSFSNLLKVLSLRFCLILPKDVLAVAVDHACLADVLVTDHDHFDLRHFARKVALIPFDGRFES